MTIKIAWAKILGLLGLTGSAGVGTGYGVTTLKNREAISRLEDEYANLEKSLTEKITEVEQLKGNNNKLKGQLNSQQLELNGKLEGKAKAIEEIAQAFERGVANETRLQLELQQLYKDVARFVGDVNQWSRENKNQTQRCYNRGDLAGAYWQPKTKTFNIGDKSATLEFVTIYCNS